MASCICSYCILYVCMYLYTHRCSHTQSQIYLWSLYSVTCIHSFSKLALWYWPTNWCALLWSSLPSCSQLRSVACGSLCRVETLWVISIQLGMLMGVPVQLWFRWSRWEDGGILMSLRGHNLTEKSLILGFSGPFCPSSAVFLSLRSRSVLRTYPLGLGCGFLKWPSSGAKKKKKGK